MRGEVRIGRSIYGVVVIDGSLCSRVYGILKAVLIVSHVPHNYADTHGLALPRAQRFLHSQKKMLAPSGYRLFMIILS